LEDEEAIWMADERVSGRATATGQRTLASLLLASSLAGALVLAVSQFLNLFGTHIQARHVVVATDTVGSEHGYALLPIALVAALLSYGVWRLVSRPALLGIGVLGLAALLITLFHDLPYANKQGLRSFRGHYVLAVNRPEIGLYVETAGALILLLTFVCGFVLLGPPETEASPRAAKAGGGGPGGVSALTQGSRKVMELTEASNLGSQGD
jgi:hypothetical protein